MRHLCIFSGGDVVEERIGESTFGNHMTVFCVVLWVLLFNFESSDVCYVKPVKLI